VDVGPVNSARWLPYLLLGLIVGALVDRRRRKPILIGTDRTSRSPWSDSAPYIAGWLNTANLVVFFVAFFGVFSLSAMPHRNRFSRAVVPKGSLLAAHARTDQSDAVAQITLIAGWAGHFAGAPIAVLVDAISYLFLCTRYREFTSTVPSIDC
jgi:hypothetical protein